MALTPNKKAAPAAAPEILPVVVQDVEAGQVAATQAQEAAQQLARQIGYEGTLTVGALEDEIRFYQRRSVEALLECGKRLLVLKELTPRGEFDQRIELLGFSRRSAYRFMQASIKASKSANLALLATQVKSASAFLELVTHDDDELAVLEHMDDVDRMSASQLRAALREAHADRRAMQDVLDKKNKRIDQLEREKVRIAATPPDERLAEDLKALAIRATEAIVTVRAGLRAGFKALLEREMEGPDEPSTRHVMAGYLDELEREIAILRQDFHLHAIDAQ